jgi:D-alanyl-D-alanine carboxypeptidase
MYLMFKKYSLQIVVVILLIAIAWALFLIGKTEEKKEVIASMLKFPIAENSAENYYPIRDWSIQEPTIFAKSALVINYRPELKDIILFQKNPFQILPIASLTKLMTGIIVLENYSLDETIKVSKNNEELTIKDLLYLMLVESNNDAATSLASDSQKLDYKNFIDLMNEEAKKTGLTNTSFVDPVGLSSCNQSTTSEIAELTKFAMSFPILMEVLKTPEATVTSIDKKFIHKITSTNKLLGKIPQLIGGKTGYTDEAGGCMMTLSKISDNNYLITVILGSSERENDTEKLITWSQEAYLW